MNTVSTAHGDLILPAFLPDGTRAVVRTIDSADLESCGIQALMVNVLHLSSRPGTSVVADFGGVHRFMGWNRPAASDSGGFQAFSLVAGPRKLGSISANGFTYRLDKGQDKKILTPEKCIQKQFQLGTDIMFCLDHCTHPDADAEAQRESVEHTVAWSRRCKAEFEKRAEAFGDKGKRPLLFAVVQGGSDPELRRECAERLLSIGFDGYGYGGWPIGDDGLLVDMVGRVSELVPDKYPKHALGIGKPENVASAFECGYRMFDCALPTRDARHKRLFVFQPGFEKTRKAGTDFYRCVYLQDRKHARDAGPLDETCDCPCCSRYSCGYLHHLFEIDDPVALRLATLHNLKFYSRLMEWLASDSKP